MRRPVKLKFEPMSLRETAKELGISRTRALKILALAGVGPEALDRTRRPKRKAAARLHSRPATAAK